MPVDERATARDARCFPSRPDPDVRLVVWAQRHPWPVSAGVVTLTMAAAGPWIHADRTPNGNLGDVDLLLVVLGLGSAALLHLGLSAADRFDRLAWPAGCCALSILLAWSWSATTRVPFIAALGVGAIVCAGCAAANAVLPGTPTSRPLRGLAALLVALVLETRVAAEVFDPDVRRGLSTMLGVAALALAPFAFHASIRSRLPSRAIVLIALGAGVLSAALRSPPSGLVKKSSPGGLSEAPRGFWPLLLLWVLAGLLIVALRRIRSMSAVPLDHPLRNEFARE